MKSNIYKKVNEYHIFTILSSLEESKQKFQIPIFFHNFMQHHGLTFEVIFLYTNHEFQESRHNRD